MGVLVAGLSALTQRNIKRVLAYSTMSQLGYMFLALGIGAWSGAIFHLVTHAFFKSLLFLGAGVVILAVNHEHDIYAMGGIARKSPFTFWTFLIAAFTLAAIPPTTAGFSSKDLILTLAWRSGGVGRVFYALGLAGVFVTSVYIFRLVFIVFAGSPRTAAPSHAGGHGHAGGGHAAGRDGMQAGAVMGIPLAILAVLCLAGGFLAFPHDLGGSPYILSFLQTALPGWCCFRGTRADGVDTPDSLRSSVPSWHSRGVARVPPRPLVGSGPCCRSCAVPGGRMGLRLAV